MSFNVLIQKKILESSIFTYIIITFIPFLLYILNICPTIYWRDSPEFIDVAYTLGISHPAGSPVYSTISKLFTFFPFSSIPFKINIVSFLFALLTIVFTCKVIQILLFLCCPTIENSEINLTVIPCSLLLTIMPSYWLKAITAEVYTMNAFFLVVILYLLFKWSISNDFRYILLAAFLYGLSSGVHAGVILFLPGILLFFFLNQKKSTKSYYATNSQTEFIKNNAYPKKSTISPFFAKRNEQSQLMPEIFPLKSFVLISFFFLLGLSIFLYLPARSIGNPEFDWGNPETLSNFYSHLSNKRDSSSFFKNITHIGILLRNSITLIKMIVIEITLIGALLLITGMLIHLRADRKGFLLLFLIAFLNALFYLTTTFTDYDSKSGTLFIPTFVIFIIWIGPGIYSIRNACIKFLPQVKPGRLIVPIVLIFIFFNFSMKYKNIEKSNYYLAEDIAKEMYVDIDQNSILFSSQYWFPNRYFQDVENLRPDLKIIHIGDMTNPEAYNFVTKARYPMLQFPEIYSTKNSFYKFWPLFIKKNIKYRKIFTDLVSVIYDTDTIHFIPYKKFLMKVVYKNKEKGFEQETENYFRELMISINNDISQDAFFLDQEEGIKTYYNIFLLNFANYLRLKGKYTRALSFLNLAESLTDEKTKGIPVMIAICLAELGRYDESVMIFKNLLLKYPGDESILTNLGNLYFKMKNYSLAEKNLKKVIRNDQNSPKPHFILGMTYFAQNRIEESIVEINKAIETTKNPVKRKKMEKYLNKVNSEKKTQN